MHTTQKGGTKTKKYTLFVVFDNNLLINVQIL